MKDELDTPRGAAHPRAIVNAPGQPAVAYRPGDFASFRAALLESREGERDLRAYRPSAEGDLALAMLEWWAYLADVLTFYNERIANASYLGTARFDDEVARLVRPLGHRRRPGIGATATLGALVNAAREITLPAGMALQSKPGPGEQPQIFELAADTRVAPGGAVAVDAVNHRLSDGRSLLLEGAVTSVKAGDFLLLAGDGKSAEDLLPVLVQSVTAEKDSRGRPRTRLTMASAIARWKGKAAQARLLRGEATIGLYPHQHAGVDGEIHLASPLTAIAAGAPILIEDGEKPAAAVVQAYREEIWSVPFTLTVDRPTGKETITHETPVPHGVLVLEGGEKAAKDESLEHGPKGGIFEPEPGRKPGAALAYPSSKRVRYGFREAGRLVTPELGASDLKSKTMLVVAAVPPARFPDGLTGGSRVLVEDATGAGVLATIVSGPSDGELTLQAAGGASFALAPPLRLLTNLIDVSRGATVRREVLGSGDASTSCQSFVLAKGPLTYLRPAKGASGALWKSTLRVHVNDVEWTEVDSFHGQPGDAAVFVTREDDERRTHVLFGDGVCGARLPTGTGNVIASYRYGSGAAAPGPGALTALLAPQPGLVAVKSPVGAAGGADPASGADMRRSAPRAVLTLGRAVSADDYEAMAALVPGVTRARAALSWDAGRQRALVTVWVHGPPGIEELTFTALAANADPNRPFQVKPAQPLPISVELTVLRDPRYEPGVVESAVRSALLDPESGLFGAAHTGIGTAVYRSRIHAACLVPGVVAVRDLSVTARGERLLVLMRTRGSEALIDPGADRFLKLDPEALSVSVQEAPYAV